MEIETTNLMDDDAVDGLCETLLQVCCAPLFVKQPIAYLLLIDVARASAHFTRCAQDCWSHAAY